MVTRRLSVSLVAIALGLSFIGASPAGAKEPPRQAECTRKPGQFTAGKAVTPAVTLTPDLPTQTINFGGGRGWQFADVVLKASKPLPAGFSPSQLDIQVLRRFSRQGDTLTTVTTPPPVFSEPQVAPSRDVITFTVCFNGERLGAGHYAGAIAVGGPTGVGPTNLAFNINAKDQDLFLWAVIPAGLLVLFLLFWRGATSVKNDNAKVVAGEVGGADATPGGTLAVPAQAAEPARTAVQTRTWSLKKNVLTDPMFWVGTVLSAAAAVAGVWAVYSANTAWGVDPVTDVVAVVSAILGAAGFRSLIASAAGK